MHPRLEAVAPASPPLATPLAIPTILLHEPF